MAGEAKSRTDNELNVLRARSDAIAWFRRQQASVVCGVAHGHTCYSRPLK